MARDNFDETGLLGGEIVNNFDSIMEQEYFEESDIRYILRNFFQDKTSAKNFRDELRKYKEGKEIDLKPEKSIIHDLIDKILSRLDENGMKKVIYDFNDDHDWIADFIDESEEQWNDFINKFKDPLAKVKMFATRRDAGFDYFISHKPEWWLCWEEPGADGYIVGDKGSGKTNFALRMCEDVLTTGKKIVSNISPLEPDKVPNYIYCQKASTLIRTAHLLRREGLEAVLLLDEGFLFQKGQTPLDPDVLKFRELGRLFRKFKFSQLIISQDVGDIHSDIKREAVFRVKKLGRNRKDQALIRMKGTFEGKEVKYNKRVKWITKTNIAHDTDNISVFRIDFEPGELYEYLSFIEDPTLQTADNQLRIAVEWLDKQGVVFSTEQRHYLSYILNEELGISMPDIADTLFHCSDKTVSRWKSKWVKGMSKTVEEIDN